MLVNREMYLKETIDSKERPALDFLTTFFCFILFSFLFTFVDLIQITISDYLQREREGGRGRGRNEKERTKLFSLWTILLLILQELFLFKLQRSHSFGLIT